MTAHGPERRGPERPGPDYPAEWDGEPEECVAGRSQFWDDHDKDMCDPEYRAAFAAESLRIDALRDNL